MKRGFSPVCSLKVGGNSKLQRSIDNREQVEGHGRSQYGDTVEARLNYKSSFRATRGSSRRVLVARSAGDSSLIHEQSRRRTKQRTNRDYKRVYKAFCYCCFYCVFYFFVSVYVFPAQQQQCCTDRSSSTAGGEWEKYITPPSRSRQSHFPIPLFHYGRLLLYQTKSQVYGWNIIQPMTETLRERWAHDIRFTCPPTHDEIWGSRRVGNIIFPGRNWDDESRFEHLMWGCNCTWFGFSTDECAREAETFAPICLESGGSVGIDCDSRLTRFSLGAIGYRTSDHLTNAATAQFWAIRVIVVIESFGRSFGKLNDALVGSLQAAHFYESINRERERERYSKLDLTSADSAEWKTYWPERWVVW